MRWRQYILYMVEMFRAISSIQIASSVSADREETEVYRNDDDDDDNVRILQRAGCYFTSKY